MTFAQDFEAHGIAELGNQISPITTADSVLGTVVVPMANFSTHAYTETVTFDVYSVAPTNAVGSLITSKTQKFSIPAGAPVSVFTITFNMATQDVTLPSKIIYGISFSTGPGPNGSNGSSYPQGGLAVGLSYTTTNVTVGSDPLHGTGSDYIDVTDANGGTNTGGGYTGNFCGGAGSHDVTQFVYDPGVGGTQPCAGTQALNHHTATPTPYLPVPRDFVPAVKLTTAPSSAEKTLSLTISAPQPTVTTCPSELRSDWRRHNSDDLRYQLHNSLRGHVRCCSRQRRQCDKPDQTHRHRPRWQRDGRRRSDGRRWHRDGAHSLHLHSCPDDHLLHPTRGTTPVGPR